MLYKREKELHGIVFLHTAQTDELIITPVLICPRWNDHIIDRTLHEESVIVFEFRV